MIKRHITNFFSNIFYIFKYIGIFYAVILLTIALQPITHINNDDANFSLANLLCIIVYYLMLKRENKNFFKYLKINNPKYTYKKLIIIFLFAINLLILNDFILYYFDNFFPKSTNYESPFNSSINAFFVAHIILLAPICEEILFRGIIFQKMKSFLGVYIALILQAILFGSLHGSYSQNLSSIVLATLSGIVYGIIYYKTNNLTISITLHSTHNLLILMLNILPINFAPNINNNLWIALLSLVLIIPLYKTIISKF